MNTFPGFRPSPASLGIFVLLLLAGLTSVRATDANPSLPRRLASTNAHNFFQVTPGLYSGSAPSGEAAFAELARLGIRIVVSVDGAKPDLELAHRLGLQYVHLPIGYDGVPTNRVPELARAARLPGPIYVHCHHGKHRGPAATAIMCLAVEGWSPAQAEDWLQQAGTSTDYPGLYRAVRDFQPPDARDLAAVTHLPESAPTPVVVDIMVAIDGHFDYLKQARPTAWKTMPTTPDIVPLHEATLLWEQLRELTRHSDTAARPADYRDKMDAAERAADLFRLTLKESGDRPNAALEASFNGLGETCSACHKIYRN